MDFFHKHRFSALVVKVMLTSLIFMLGVVPGCKKISPPNQIILTLWHNFGGQMQTTMDGLVDEFNKSLGKEKGILINITSISDSATIREKLAMIAADDPGAPEMPDIATCYPQTAAFLAAQDLIVPLEDYIAQEELSAYLPRFLDEGRLENQLYVFPFAKSTEVLFLNQTLFDEFSQATGIMAEQLSTFEGIAEAAIRYYQWTDEQTPDIPGDGKNFFTADSLFNLAQVGMQQLGRNFIDNQQLQLDSQEYEHVWSCIFEPAVKGGYAIYPGYSSDLSKTGDIVCSTGSTAGILFYGTEITYPDNTTREVEYSVLPFPVFAGGDKIAMQRGGGLVVAKSAPEKEKAAALFLKWFTAPEQNMKFVASTGYLPVTHEAFEEKIAEEIAANENENIRKLLAAAITVYEEYDYYIPPVFDDFDTIRISYETEYKKFAEDARVKYLRLLEDMEPEQAYEEAVSGVYEAFITGR